MKKLLIRTFILRSTVVLLGLTSVTSLSSQVIQSTFSANGIFCTLKEGMLQVDFVTPDIVRVQYTKEAKFVGNGTDVVSLVTRRGFAFLIGKRRNIFG